MPSIKILSGVIFILFTSYPMCGAAEKITLLNFCSNRLTINLLLCNLKYLQKQGVGIIAA
jgi:hypothetical protein